MRRILLTALSLLLCASLSGCFSMSAEELFAQPKQPRDAVRLQAQIDKQLAAGAQLVPPVGGVNRQAIQKVDVDGCGQEEAVIFYRTQGDKPLSIVFYRRIGEDYEPFAYIEGEGEAIDSITYVDMNNSGIPMVLVGWRAGQGVLKALDIYRMEEGQMQQLCSISNYSAYALQDFLGDGRQDLLILRQDITSPDGLTKMYEYEYDGLEIRMVSEAPLTDGVEIVQRVRTGLLLDGRPAVFVVSQYDTSAVVTDIFTERAGKLLNVTRNEETGVSDAMVRRYTVPAGIDINGDGALDIPDPEELRPYDPVAEASEGPWMIIHWRCYDSWGNSRVVKTTWHDYADSWYLELPATWLSELVVTRRSFSSGEKGVVFALREEAGPPRDLLIVYSLTGNNRAKLAAREGRVKLLERWDMIIAAEILPQAVGPYAIDKDELAGWKDEKISWIQKEWITGDVSLG